MEAYRLYITNKEDTDGYYGVMLIAPVEKLYTILDAALAGENEVKVLGKIGGEVCRNKDITG